MSVFESASGSSDPSSTPSPRGAHQGMTPVEFSRLFDDFRSPTWDAWRERLLARLTPDIREVYLVAGRGSGKSRIVALLACCWAAHHYSRAAGEQIFVGVFAPDRRQAGVTLRYVVGLLRSVPQLAALIVAERADGVELSNGVTIEVITASTAAPRGRSYALAIIEEASMLDVDDSAAEPDVELVRALRPGLARVEGSLLVVLGTPYRQAGVLFEGWKAGTGEDRLVISADTLTMNPTFRRREVDRAFEVDPVGAASEYGKDGEVMFRAHVHGLLTADAIAAVTPAGVRELAPSSEFRLRAHFDAATGAGQDAAAFAIAVIGRPARLALVRRWRPPFSPLSVVAAVANLCREWNVHEVTLDRFAPGVFASLLRERGVPSRVSEHDTSSAFVTLLALINSKRVQLLDEPALLGELQRLERRPSSGGREQVGHPPHAHDDLAAAAAFALVAAARRLQRRGILVWDIGGNLLIRRRAPAVGPDVGEVIVGTGGGAGPLAVMGTFTPDEAAERAQRARLGVL